MSVFSSYSKKYSFNNNKIMRSFSMLVLAKFLINNAKFAGRRLCVWVPSVSVGCAVCRVSDEERGGGETSGIPTLTNNYHNILWSADITLMSILINLLGKVNIFLVCIFFKHPLVGAGSIEQINKLS